LTPYWVGVCGSAVVEAFAFAQALAKNDGVVPKRYTRPAHCVTRVVIPFFAGSLPMIMDAATPLIAFYLGASAPVLVDKLAEGVMPRIGGPPDAATLPATDQQSDSPP
jgi:hypothetical protein